MYLIAFMSDPDEEENIYYRIPEPERMEMLKETFASDIDTEDELWQECLIAYGAECLTAVERALKIEKDALTKRAMLIKDTELTLDRTQIVGDKSVIIKGTATQINTLQKDFPKILAQYAQAEQEFIKSKALARVEGGAKLAKSEEEGFW